MDTSNLIFPKSRPAVLAKHAKRTAAKAALDAAYDAVDARDGRRCCVRGTYLVAGSLAPWKRLERHHLDGRVGAKRSDPDTILTVSAAVHALFESASLIAVDAHGRETRSVLHIAGFEWNPRMVPAGKAPFRLKEK